MFYHYIQRNNSSIKTLDERVILDTEEIIRLVNKNLNELNLMDKFKDEYCAFVMRMFSVATHKIYSYSTDSKLQKEYIKKLLNSNILNIKENYKNFNDKYIYDLFHKISINSLRISKCNSNKYNLIYKSLFNSQKIAIKIYKVFKPIIKK